MANLITVNSGTGNITVTTSRAVIGTVVTANTANYANFAGEANTANSATTATTANTANTANVANTATTAGTVTTNAQPNITSVGTLGNLDVSGTIETQDLVVTGNFSVGNLVANSANYANFAGEAFSVDGANVSGEVAVANVVSNPTQSNITAVGTLGNLDVSGTITANVIQANTIEANLAFTNVDYIDFDTGNGSPGFQTGRVYWDSAKGTLALDMNGGGNITQQVGEDQYIYVKANATITAGQVAMFNGVQGDTILAAPANTASAGFLPRYVIGVAPANIASGSFGYIQSVGEIYNLQTNAFSAGSILYLQANSAGALTATEPTAPDPSIVVAACLVQSNNPSATNGKIQVRPDFGYYMDQLHDVSNATPSTGDVLVYNASNVYAPSNTVPLANLATFATTANAVAGANVSGEVAFANVANNVAGANVSGSVANAVYADSAGSAPPAGSDQQVQFNDGGALGADSVFTYNKSIPALSVGFANTGAVYTSQLATNKTLTTNTFVFSTTANLNNASVDYTVWKANVTDTNSGANTKLIDMIVDGNSMMTLSKTGALEVSGNVTGDNLNGVNANLTGNVDATNVLTTSGNISYNITPSQTDITGEGLDCTTTIVGYADYSTYQFGTSHMNMLENMDDGTEFAYFGRIKEDWGFAKNANNDQASAGYITWTVNDILDPNTYPNQSVIGGTWSVQIPTLGSDYESGAFDTRTWSGFEVGGQGGLNLTDGSGGIGIPTFNINHYQDDGLRFNRRTGNGAARSAVVADDYLGEIQWRGAVDATSFLATVTSSDSGTNFFTADDVGAMDPNMEVQFFGTTFGGVSTGVSYWLSYVDYDTNEFSISDTRFGPERALTTGSGSMDIEQVSLPYSSPAKFGAKVDSSFTGAVNDPLPIGLEMIVIDDADNPITHSFYANGNSSFSGDVTATNINATQFVVLANDTVANLTSNTPAVVGVAGAMIAVSDQDYQPAHWSVTDNVWKYVSNRANV